VSRALFKLDGYTICKQFADAFATAAKYTRYRQKITASNLQSVFKCAQRYQLISDVQPRFSKPIQYQTQVSEYEENYCSTFFYSLVFFFWWPFIFGHAANWVKQRYASLYAMARMAYSNDSCQRLVIRTCDWFSLLLFIYWWAIKAYLLVMISGLAPLVWYVLSKEKRQSKSLL